MKKRLLSLILAITMIATLLPAMALSAGAEDVSYTYSFNPKEAAGGTDLTTYTYTDSDTDISDAWAYVTAKNLHANTNPNPQAYVNGTKFSGMYIRWSGSGAPWVAVKIKVPTAGTYEATLGYGERSVGATINVYMLPATTTTLAGTEASFSDDYKLNNSPINTLNSDLTKPNAIVPVSLKNTFTTTVDNEERIVIFDADATNTQQYAYIANLVIKQVVSYDVTFDASGGSAAPAAMKSPAGEITLPEAITRDGYTFLGWSDGNNTYDAGATYTVSGNVNFTAQWKALSGYTFVYDLNPGDAADGSVEDILNYDYTKGMSEFAYRYGATAGFNGAVGIALKSAEPGQWCAVKINVPVTDTYKITLNHRQNVKDENGGGTGDMYILPADMTYTKAYALLETEDAANYKVNKAPIKYQDLSGTKNGPFDTDIADAKELTAGEHIVVFYAAEKGTVNAWMYPHVLTLTSGEGGKTPAYAGYVELNDDSILIGKSTTAETKLWNAVTGEVVATTGKVAYTATPGEVVSISGNTLTGASEGSAEITAEYTGDIADGYIVSDSITVEYAEKAPATVSFGVLQNNGADEDITVSGVDGYVVGEPGSAPLGTTITLTAEEVSATGATFAYWKVGNKILSENAVTTCKLNTNTSITAVYDADEATSEDKKVEFWSAGGAFITTLTADENGLLDQAKIPTAPFTGFKFENWATMENGTETVFDTAAELTKALTRAVAKHSETGNAVGAVTYNGEAVDEALTYNNKVELTDNSAKYWTRKIGDEDKIVAYGTTYEYHMWDATEIKSHSDEIEEKPVVVLDDYANGSYMIEYCVPEGYTKEEAGILYGLINTPHIGSFNSKAASEKSDRHGQFTAAPSGDNEAVVRGYLVYRDGEGVRRVLYTEAKTID